jgi:hypothetical protein
MSDFVYDPCGNRYKSAEDRFLRVTAILLVIVTFAIFLTGPSVVERRFRIPVDFWSLPSALLIGAGCVVVPYIAFRRSESLTSIYRLIPGG